MTRTHRRGRQTTWRSSISTDTSVALGSPSQRRPHLRANGADGTLVEAAGLISRTEYAAKLQRKRELALRDGLRLIVVEPSDLSSPGQLFVDRTPA